MIIYAFCEEFSVFLIILVELIWTSVQRSKFSKTIDIVQFQYETSKFPWSCSSISKIAYFNIHL